jgi:hypothetical protein
MNFVIARCIAEEINSRDAALSNTTGHEHLDKTCKIACFADLKNVYCSEYCRKVSRVVYLVRSR